ncbi:MAG: site-specific integrase [Neisseriales bacterium]|nr:MAG: site-specific integrase [Neisseriales bacterium]
MGKQATTQLQSGVRERNSKIQIDFYWQGKRYRETLPIEPTPKNIKFAAQLRAAILFDISQGVFDYAKYFPNSKRVENVVKTVTVGKLLNQQLELYERRHDNGSLQLSTFLPYKRAITKHLLPYFGDIEITDLTPSVLRDWVMSLNAKAKTYRNIMIPLTATIRSALVNGLIAENPIDKADLPTLIKQIALPKSEAINPFNEDEREKIIAAATGQIKNLIEFGFYSGLRIGELIALRWHDVDFESGLIRVSRNIVYNQEKAPKTNSGIRTVLILTRARAALMRQLSYTGSDKDFVFHNPNTNQRWRSDDSIRDAWIPILKTAGVEYRYPYQMRHTYASMLLTGGENIAWIAKQMGHINTEMVIKNYGKFIPDTNFTGGYKPKGNY